MKQLDIFLEILKSESFKNKLETINQNYPNLKQESFIRNAFLEIINATYSNVEVRAFAEHPREKGRTDLSIVNSANNSVYKIELKFQFTKDDENFINYRRIIEKDFIYKNSDLFILIVCFFDEKDKKEFDKLWGISSRLYRYQSKTECWRDNIKICFNEFLKESDLQIFEFNFSKPYTTNYNFYLLNKNNKELILS